MPYGIQRLNVKRSQPNANIVFIKPLAGPDEKIAQDFLERIAAQCRMFFEVKINGFDVLMRDSSRHAGAYALSNVPRRVSTESRVRRPEF